MKPDTIILIRHGQSEGNVDKNIYTKKPDYALDLTERGRLQAREAGEQLIKRYGSFADFAVYYSPFFRSIQTLTEMAGAVADKGEFYQFQRKYVREEPRIREQEWQTNIPSDGYDNASELERDAYGHFYYRFNGGESCADVYDRVSDFMDTLHRDFDKQDFPRKCLIVTHGMTMRVFLMRWYHKPVAEFELWKNPANCGMYILKKNFDNKYDIDFNLEYHTIKHSYQCPLTIKMA